MRDTRQLEGDSKASVLVTAHRMSDGTWSLVNSPAAFHCIALVRIQEGGGFCWGENLRGDASLGQKGQEEQEAGRAGSTLP